MRKYQNTMERKADVPPMFLPLFQTLVPSPNIIYWNIKEYSTLTSVLETTSTIKENRGMEVSISWLKQLQICLLKTGVSLLGKVRIAKQVNQMILIYNSNAGSGFLRRVTRWICQNPLCRCGSKGNFEIKNPNSAEDWPMVGVFQQTRISLKLSMVK